MVMSPTEAVLAPVVHSSRLSGEQIRSHDHVFLIEFLTEDIHVHVYSRKSCTTCTAVGDPKLLQDEQQEPDHLRS